MFWQIFLFILGILFLIPFIIVVIKLNKSIRKVPVTPNMPIVENDYRKEFTNGYTLGTLKSKRKCKNGCTRVEFYPIDVEQGEEVPRPEVQSFIIKDDYIKHHGVGELSDYRQRIKTVTRNPLLIPKRMQDTIDADYTTKEGQLAWLKSEMGKMIPAGDDAIAEMMKDYARGSMTKSQLAILKETAQKYNESRIQMPEKSEEEVKK